MKITDKLETKDRLKIFIFISILICIIFFLEKKTYPQEIEHFFEKQEVLISVSDQMFEPRHPNYPEMLYHNFTKDKKYKVMYYKFVKDTMKLWVNIKNHDTLIKRIDFKSIKYPKELKYSKKQCYVDIQKIKNNNLYVFFETGKFYPYRIDNGKYWVLDENRNQVQINQEFLIFNKK